MPTAAPNTDSGSTIVQDEPSANKHNQAKFATLYQNPGIKYSILNTDGGFAKRRGCNLLLCIPQGNGL